MAALLLYHDASRFCHLDSRWSKDGIASMRARASFFTDLPRVCAPVGTSDPIDSFYVGHHVVFCTYLGADLLRVCVQGVPSDCVFTFSALGHVLLRLRGLSHSCSLVL